MSEKRRSGRKKHIVEGEVSAVRRSAESLGNSQGVGRGNFMSVLRRIIRGSINEEKK